MKKYLLLLFPLVLSACIEIGVNDIDIHQAFYRNESSRNIYIQENSRYVTSPCGYENIRSGKLFISGMDLAPKTLSELVAPTEGYNLEKILIIDTTTRTILKTIDAQTYFNKLVLQNKTEEKDAYPWKTTRYTYHFVITDELLNGK